LGGGGPPPHRLYLGGGSSLVGWGVGGGGGGGRPETNKKEGMLHAPSNTHLSFSHHTRPKHTFTLLPSLAADSDPHLHHAPPGARHRGHQPHAAQPGGVHSLLLVQEGGCGAGVLTRVLSRQEGSNRQRVLSPTRHLLPSLTPSSSLSHTHRSSMPSSSTCPHVTCRPAWMPPMVAWSTASTSTMPAWSCTTTSCTDGRTARWCGSAGKRS
jgi:hypothetical protein